MKRTKRIPFTEKENKLIKKMVKKVGKDWEEISKFIPGRTPKQIHDRYINYLRDGLKKDPWTSEEDEILINMYQEIGNKWSKMIKKLPGRSGNDIKNRWHKHLCKNNFSSSKNNDVSVTLINSYDDLKMNKINQKNIIQTDEKKNINEKFMDEDSKNMDSIFNFNFQEFFNELEFQNADFYWN